jgi:hypothetical protein
MKVGQAPRAIVRRGRGATAGTALACVSAQMRPQVRFTGHGRVHLALRVRQALVTSRGARSAVSFAQAVTRVWPTLPAAVALASALVLLGGCADLSEFRTDLSHVRADLHATTQGLSQLSARMDALERRQGEAESAARHTHQDLSQAMEALSKALSPKGPQITRGARKSLSPKPAKPEGQARELSAGGPEAASRGGNVRPGRRQLRLGMTPDEVRHKLGEPLRIEPAGAYVVWHYAPISTQQYVIFEHLSGQVAGWHLSGQVAVWRGP